MAEGEGPQERPQRRGSVGPREDPAHPAVAQQRHPALVHVHGECGLPVGVIFAYWLLYQSTFVIGALCPWCVLVTVSTTFVFVSMTHWSILENNPFLSPRQHAKAVAFARGGWLTILLVGWLTLIALAEIIKWGPRLFS